MSPRYEDPGNVDLEGFGAFDTNVFKAQREVDVEDLLKPFDPEERRLFEKQRAVERGEIVDAVDEEELLRETIETQLAEAEALRAQAAGELEAARREADRLIEEAREEARELVLQAQRDSEAVEARGYQAGFEQGEEAGRRLGDQKVETIVKSLSSVVESFLAQQRDLLVASERDIVKIAAALALKLIQRELRQDPTVVLDVVREAVARMQGSTALTIHVSPSDFQFIEGHLEEFRRLTEGDADIVLEPDSAVDRGGCRVRSDCGEVDATLRTMVRAFLDELTDEAPGPFEEDRPDSSGNAEVAP